MPTAREHMAADMAWLYAQTGEEPVDVIIDGVSRRAIVQELDAVAGNFDGGVIRRRAIWLLKGTITLPRPGYVMTVDGDRWTVESLDPTGILDVITLAQVS